MSWTSGGWCNNATQIVSPNFDERPQGIQPEVLIIHSISLPPGKYTGPGVEQLFTNRLNAAHDPYYQQIQSLRVSCHFFIRRDGELIQFVSTHHRAWHCGESSCLGRNRVNDFSIGVELEGLDNSEFEQVQYERLVELTKALQRAFPLITQANILGHQHIAPARKTDPGIGFNWYTYFSLLH